MTKKKNSFADSSIPRNPMSVSEKINAMIERRKQNQQIGLPKKKPGK